MKTKITVEWEGNVKQQASTNDDGEMRLSKFLECIIGDALSHFEKQRSGHKIEEVSIKVSGYKVCITQEE